jgi:hypothetical protein
VICRHQRCTGKQCATCSDHLAPAVEIGKEGVPVPTFGCAYWGRDATTADGNFASLADIGFSWVVIPVSTERMRFDRAGAAAVIAAAKREGLSTRIAPWGVGGIFGGEGIVEAGRTPAASLAWWLSSARDLQPDAMFWDEPHGDLGLDVMREAMTTLIIPGDEQYLYINPDLSAWPKLPANASLAGIGLDAYRDPAEAVRRLPGVRRRYNLPVHVWVRNFALPAGQTTRPAEDISALLEAGVSEIGVWGFPSAGCSCLDNAEPRRAWDGIVEAIAGAAIASAA